MQRNDGDPRLSLAHRRHGPDITKGIFASLPISAAMWRPSNMFLAAAAVEAVDRLILGTAYLENTSNRIVCS